MNDKNSKKSKAFIAVMSTLMVLASGCAYHDIGKVKIKKTVIENLESYYGGSFEVTDIEKVTLDTSGGFNTKQYNLNVYSDELDEEFKVWINLDGTDMNENYEALLYQDQLESEVSGYEAEQNGWLLKNVEIKHYDVGDTERGLSYEGYKATGKVVVRVDIDVTGTDMETVAQSIYKYIEILQSNPYKWRVDLTHNGSSGRLSKLSPENNYSESDVENVLERIGVG